MPKMLPINNEQEAKFLLSCLEAMGKLNGLPTFKSCAIMQERIESLFTTETPAQEVPKEPETTSNKK